jgi:hypothetical protein
MFGTFGSDTAILDTLRHSDISDPSTWTRINSGVTRPHRAMVGNVPVILKHSLRGWDARYEAAAWEVSRLSPGLVNLPETVLRRCPCHGDTVSVARWVDGMQDGDTLYGDMSSLLASDLRGLAFFDWLISNADRHGANFGWLPEGGAGAPDHGHHRRVIAIDHGGAFRNYGLLMDSPSGLIAGQRIPHYLHDHAARVAAGTDTLRAFFASVGLPASEADRVGTIAARMTTARTFPSVY